MVKRNSSESLSSWSSLMPSPASTETSNPIQLRAIDDSSSDDSPHPSPTTLSRPLTPSDTSLVRPQVPASDKPIISANLPKSRDRKKHSRFYLPDDMIVFLVEDTYYRVHYHFFTQYSEDFALDYNLSDRVAFIHLEDVKTRDFEQLLSIFYPSTLSEPYPETKTVEQWTSVLRLATKWKFTSLRKLAVERLFDITSSIDKVILGHTFDLPDWLPLAYTELCERDKPITIEEGKRLGELGEIGGDIVIRLWQVCHELKPRSLATGRKSTTETVKRIFGLVDTEPQPCPVHKHDKIDMVEIDDTSSVPTSPVPARKKVLVGGKKKPKESSLKLTRKSL